MEIETAPPILPTPASAPEKEEQTSSPVPHMVPLLAPTMHRDLVSIRKKPRVLVVHPAASTGRLIRESLQNFTQAEIDLSPDTSHGFEMALSRRYHLFIFALHLPDMDGPLLYEMISKAYAAFREGESRTAPGVIFVREPEERLPPPEISRDARVKGILSKPLSIERLLDAVKSTLPMRDPM
ncbi:MAG: hypothetical protein JNK37_13750 [Verrucomicrobiales bacterium]|nr:hypothetical protein [Verrucomicrobiales bacterium]